MAPSKQESTTYEPSLVCKLLILGCRLLIPDRLLGNRDRGADGRFGRRASVRLGPEDTSGSAVDLSTIQILGEFILIRKIATAAIYVENQQKSVDFWTKQVGFEIQRVEPMGPDARWIEVGPPGAESCLVIYPSSMMGDWKERKPSIVFESDDVDETYEETRGRGVEFSQQPTAMAWGPFAIFEDVDGNWFGLRGRSTGDSIRGDIRTGKGSSNLHQPKSAARTSTSTMWKALN